MEGKNIYILLAFALLCWQHRVSPHWRRPVASLAIILRFTDNHPARPVDDAQLVMPC
jgi:hypothetical protein